MLFLFFSIVFLLSGPLVYTFAIKKPMLLHRYEYIFISLTSLFVLFHMAPQAYYVIGYWILVPFLVGIILPWFLEKIWHQLSHNVDLLNVFIIAIALAIHAFNDGIVISQPFFSGWLLPMIIVLHRIPDSILIWFVLGRYASHRLAAGMLVLVALLTILGFWMGKIWFDEYAQSLSVTTNFYFYLFLMFSMGGMLHLLFHKPHHEEDACIHKS